MCFGMGLVSEEPGGDGRESKPSFNLQTFPSLCSAALSQASPYMCRPTVVILIIIPIIFRISHPAPPKNHPNIEQARTLLPHRPARRCPIAIALAWLASVSSWLAMKAPGIHPTAHTPGGYGLLGAPRLPS